MAETETLGAVEAVTIKVEMPDPIPELAEQPMTSPTRTATPTNGETTNEGRSRRSRKATAYNLEALCSDSDPQSETEGDPEFSPSLSPLPNIPKPQLTGYSLFCSDNRPAVQKQFPEMPANKINMKLSHMWSSLPAGTKRSYSCRARHMRPDGAKRMKREHKKEQPIASQPEETEVVVFCCLWGRCDFQFEMVDECAQHISDDHIRLLCHPDTEVLKAPSSCCWQGCLRQKRCSLPFVQFERLLRHMSEEHVLVGKSVRMKERSETAYNHTMEKQPGEPEDVMNEPLPSMSEPIEVQDALVSTLATPLTQPLVTASKSKAQRQREYRQRIATSRTPAQTAAARKAKNERQRKSRLRQAANLAIASGSLEATTTSAPKTRAEIQRGYRQRIAAFRTPAQAVASREARNARERNNRLRQAANSVIACDSLEATNTSSSRSGQV